jgi:hypothetical protein
MMVSHTLGALKARNPNRVDGSAGIGNHYFALSALAHLLLAESWAAGPGSNISRRWRLKPGPFAIEPAFCAKSGRIVADR